MGGNGEALPLSLSSYPKPFAQELNVLRSELLWKSNSLHPFPTTAPSFKASLEKAPGAKGWGNTGGESPGLENKGGGERGSYPDGGPRGGEGGGLAASSRGGMWAGGRPLGRVEWQSWGPFSRLYRSLPQPWAPSDPDRRTLLPPPSPSSPTQEGRWLRL